MASGDQGNELTALRRQVTQLQDELVLEKQRLRNCEERFRRMADAAPFMIWTSGADALCTYFNRSWLDFRGRALEQELGNGWTEGLHPDDRELCIGTYLKAFSGREAFRMQYRMRRADGAFGWLDESGAPCYDGDGSFMGFMVTAVDITDRKQGVFTPDQEAVRMVFALTERERQVLVLISEGKSTKEAAARLGISYKTADSHRSRILEKLGVHETASMVRYAIRAGLIQP